MKNTVYLQYMKVNKLIYIVLTMYNFSRFYYTKPIIFNHKIHYIFKKYLMCKIITLLIINKTISLLYLINMYLSIQIIYMKNDT